MSRRRCCGVIWDVCRSIDRWVAKRAEEQQEIKGQEETLCVCVSACAFIYVCKWSNPHSFIDQRWGRWWAERLLKIHLKWRWGFQLLTAVVLSRLKLSHTVTDNRSVQNSSLITFVIFSVSISSHWHQQWLNRKLSHVHQQSTTESQRGLWLFFHSLAAVAMCVCLWLYYALTDHYGLLGEQVEILKELLSQSSNPWASAVLLLSVNLK